MPTGGAIAPPAPPWNTPMVGSQGFWLFGPHTFFHIPHGQCPFVKKKNRRFFPKNLSVKNENSIKNVVTNFLEFIGFMVCKITVSISRLTCFLRFEKLCFVARDISNSLSFFILHFCEYLWLWCIVFQTVKNSLTVRSRRSFWCKGTLSL